VPTARRFSDVEAIFTLASGRSGTHFLYELIRRNAVDCVARHETYGFNPSLFGRPIYDYSVGEPERTRRLVERKRRIVEGCGAQTYMETSHAFLKSWFHLAPEVFPRFKLVHLVRDPLFVAKSEASREELIKKLRVPFCHYRGGDRKRYFLWSLTGLEPIFRHFDAFQLTRLQWYVIQWIEIENRAMRFLDEFQKHGDCFTLESPRELNSAERVRQMFQFLGLQMRFEQINLSGRRNRNWRATAITDEDRSQFAEVVAAMPRDYLQIFRREPYAAIAWAESLHSQ
jgi:hypothetical protein